MPRRQPFRASRLVSDPARQHRFNRRGVKSDTLGATKGVINGEDMKELLRTNDMVKLSWLEALLADAGIDTLVLDQHTSVLEGSIGILPRRLMVSDQDYQRARHVMSEAGEETSP